MLKKRVLLFIGFMGTAVSSLWFSCTNNDPTAAAPNSAKVFGYVYKQDGTPATGAKVTIVRADYVPEKGVTKKAAANLFLVTDNQGCFASNDITSGTYNIFAKTDGAGSFTPSVKVDSSQRGVCIAKSTLQATGSIQGKIRFSPWADSRAVLVLVLGSEIAGWPYDSLGNFSLNNMAPGNYRIRILPVNPQYSIIDTAISVESEKTTDIGTIVLSITDTVIVQDEYIRGVWGPDKTYKIVCSVNIPKGEKLEIKEGTHIVFMGNYIFSINGNCFAKGTVDKPILFTSGFKNSGDEWNCIGGHSGDDTNKPDSLVFNNCIFEYCFRPAFAYNSPLSELYFEMKNCIFRHIQDGLSIEIPTFNLDTLNIGKRVIVRNCIFHDIGAIDSVFDTLAYQKYVDQMLEYYNQVAPPVYVHEYNSSLPCETPSVQITNNIFYKEEWGGTIHCYYPYNCYTSTFLGKPGDSTNIFGDPMFVDIKNGDYHLKPGSSCIGAGTGGEDMGIDFSDTTGR
jgi:hypothetical protein